ncbi:MAG: hypothetical protein ACP5M4_15500, partial [Acidobacteriaceae bacterium]
MGRAAFAGLVEDVAGPGWLVGGDIGWRLALEMGWGAGAVVAAWSMGGDLFSSFCKRRLGVSSGGRATGLDQIPEALFPALAVRGMPGLSWLDGAVVVGVFLVGEMLLSVLFFRWHLRDRPYQGLLTLLEWWRREPIFSSSRRKERRI